MVRTRYFMLVFGCFKPSTARLKWSSMGTKADVRLGRLDATEGREAENLTFTFRLSELFISHFHHSDHFQRSREPLGGGCVTLRSGSERRSPPLPLPG